MEINNPDRSYSSAIVWEAPRDDARFKPKEKTWEEITLLSCNGVVAFLFGVGTLYTLELYFNGKQKK